MKGKFMNKVSRLLIGGLTSAALLFGGAGVAQASPAAPVGVVKQAKMTNGNIWSSIFKMVMTFTKHGADQARKRGITNGEIGNALDVGKVVARNTHGKNTATVALGKLRVAVNTKTGKIITTYRTGVGSGGGGGYAGGR